MGWLSRVGDYIASRSDQPAARVEAIARGRRGPEESRIADIPGVPHYGVPSNAQRVLESWGAMSARVAPEAGPSRTRYSLWPADDLTPARIIDAQRQAVSSGNPLIWVEMIDQAYSRDGHYASVTSQRVADVIKGPWRLTRSGDTDAATITRNFTDACYRNCSRFRDALGWLLYSNLYGYNSVEAEWVEDTIDFPGPEGERIGPIRVARPQRLHNVHPKHLRFDPESDDPLFWIGNGYEPLPLGKFIFLEGDGLHPVKVRHGHAWQCIFYSMFRSGAWASWATRVDRFDMPIPVLGYNGDIAQYDEYKQAQIDIDKSLGSGKGVRYPKDNMSLDIKDPPQGGRASDPQSALANACDVGQTIRVLGAEMTNATGNTGSFAAKAQDMMVKFALEEADAGRLWERIDEQLTAPLVLFNCRAIAEAANRAGYNVTPQELCRSVPRGKQRVPREVDPRAEMDIVAGYVRMGLPISMEGMFDRIDFPRALDDADRIPGEAQQVGKGAALVSPAEAAEKPAVNPDVAAEKKAAAEKPPTAMHRMDHGFTESDHPRAHGKFAPKGSSGSSEAADAGDDEDDAPPEKPSNWAPVKTAPVPRREEGGKSLPGASPGMQLPPAVRERLKSLGVTKLPAADIGEVHVSDRIGDDAAAHDGALLKWKDNKGHPQAAYTPQFDKRNAEAKWQRVLANRPRIAAAIDALRDKAQSAPAHAAALLIAQTGLRPGSTKSVKDHGHYGVSTMEARHVTFSGSVAHVEYVGKEGVTNRATVDDPALVSALKKNVEGKSPNDRVFATTKDKIAAAVPEGVKLKDLRTTQATNDAERYLGEEHIKITPPPSKADARAVAKLLKDVSTKVSVHLNNTPAMARRSYIAPQIIQQWAEKHGIPKEWIE